MGINLMYIYLMYDIFMYIHMHTHTWIHMFLSSKHTWPPQILVSKCHFPLKGSRALGRNDRLQSWEKKIKGLLVPESMEVLKECERDTQASLNELPPATSETV